VMELAIDWPVIYQESCRMALAVTGSVVRSDERGTAIRIAHHALRPWRHEVTPAEALESESIVANRRGPVGKIVRMRKSSVAVV